MNAKYTTIIQWGEEALVLMIDFFPYCYKLCLSLKQGKRIKILRSDNEVNMSLVYFMITALELGTSVLC